MKKILTYVTLVLLFVIQTSAGHYIRLWGVLPNPAFSFTIVYALTNGSFRGAALGLCCGLLFDSGTHIAFGFFGLVVMYLSCSASFFSRRYYYENKLSIFSGVFIYTIIFESISLIFTAVLYGEAPFFYSFARFVLPEALINSLISIPLLMWVKWLNNEYIRGI